MLVAQMRRRRGEAVQPGYHSSSVRRGVCWYPASEARRRAGRGCRGRASGRRYRVL